MTTYLIIQTIVLAVVAGFLIYDSTYDKSQTGHWIDRMDLLYTIAISLISIMLIFMADAFAFIIYHGINR